MKVYLLWYNDWESNTMMGVFKTRDEAAKWKEYFILYPENSGHTLREYNEEIEGLEEGIEDIIKDIREDNEKRLHIQEWELGELNSYIKLDNLKYLEFCESKKNV